MLPLTLSRTAAAAVLTLCAAVAAASASHSPQGDSGPGPLLVTEEASPGYTLIAPLSSRTTYLLDLRGRVAHRWPSRYPPGNAVHLLPDGSILRCGRDGENPVFSGGGQGGYVERIAWDGTPVWTLDWSSDEHLQHHEVVPLPSGHVILVAWERKSREQALAAGRDPACVGEDGLWPDYLVEIEPVLPEGGNVVWEWHAWDHLIQDFDPERTNYGDVTAHPELVDVNADHRGEPPLSAAERRRRETIEEEMRALGYTGDDEDEGERGAGDGRWDRADWLHTNSVAFHPDHDLLLLSVRRLSEIWVIDHSTTTSEAAGHVGGRWGKGGDLLYRWGNPRNHGAAGKRTLFAQHDAQWIQVGLPGAGHVLLFNNGGGRPGGDFSSVDELALPFDPERGFTRTPDAAFGACELVWSYGAAEGDQHFYSSFLSGAQRLPNGNTLVCSGAEGRVFELTRDLRVVWNFRNPYGDDEPAGGRVEPPTRPEVVRGLFRATRIAADHPGLAGRELGPE